MQGKISLILLLGTGARTTTPNVTHPPPTYRLGGTSEIQLTVRKCRGCSTPLRSDELNFVAFPRAKRMGAVPWVSFGAESEERPEE